MTRNELTEEQSQWVAQLLDDDEFDTRAEAVQFVLDPVNKVMCDECRWTNAMVCPECPGCGCYNGRCTGWRHTAYAEDNLASVEVDLCWDCGGEYRTNRYGCTCPE